ncbi:MAG: NAD(P)/FAD-dependent oxidoreductase [Paraclostridium sp.]
MEENIINNGIYDVCIVGAGISGIFLAYNLVENSNKKIILIEKGNKFEDRICPIESKSTPNCISCDVCNKVYGFGGLGRSEGKFNYTNDFGGNLGSKIGNELSLKLMNKVDGILCRFGADKANIYSTENEMIKNLAKENSFEILTTKTRHLGTKLSYEIMQKMYEYLKDKIDIVCEIKLNNIAKNEGIFILDTDKIQIKSKDVVLAIGTNGKNKLEEYCKEIKIDCGKTRVDIGLRVEMKENQLDDILKHSKEIKIYYSCKEYDAFTYCMNPKGRVIKKYQNNMVMADGQNHNETNNPSSNLNFTVFVPRYFDTNTDAYLYAKNILNSINDNNDRIVVQRLDDLLNNRHTNIEKLSKNTIKPTLNAIGCNLYNEIPKVYIDGGLSILKCIENIIGDDIDRDTLLYGVDIKFYEPEVITSKHFESNVKNLYVIGDCSGTTYSLSQAAACGIYVGEYLSKLT